MNDTRLLPNEPLAPLETGFSWSNHEFHRYETAPFGAAVGSPFTLASLTATTLNCLFRIGVSQRVNLSIEPLPSGISTVVRFLEKSGAAWGARRVVVQRVQAAVSELLESVVMTGLSKGNIEIRARFDEYNLDVEVVYEGLPFPDAGELPSPEKLLDDENAVLRLSGLLIQHHADRVGFSGRGDRQHIALHFDH